MALLCADFRSRSYNDRRSPHFMSPYDILTSYYHDRSEVEANHMHGDDCSFLREAILEAYNARQRGERPIGAVLVLDGRIVHRSGDMSVATNDPTAHAEMVVISGYCREQALDTLYGYTLYTSTEPCVMCSGAIHWARISRVVYSVSQEMLQQLSGGRPKPKCESLINVGAKKIEVVGPLIPEEGIKVFDGFEFRKPTDGIGP